MIIFTPLSPSYLNNNNNTSTWCFLTTLVSTGQYDGRSKPLPEYHAKITGFDERVGSPSLSRLHVTQELPPSQLRVPL